MHNTASVRCGAQWALSDEAACTGLLTGCSVHQRPHVHRGRRPLKQHVHTSHWAQNHTHLHRHDLGQTGLCVAGGPHLVHGVNECLHVTSYGTLVTPMPTHASRILLVATLHVYRCNQLTEPAPSACTRDTLHPPPTTTPACTPAAPLVPCDLTCPVLSHGNLAGACP